MATGRIVRHFMELSGGMEAKEGLFGGVLGGVGGSCCRGDVVDRMTVERRKNKMSI